MNLDQPGGKSAPGDRWGGVSAGGGGGETTADLPRG
jgi:hypothetical protein